MLIQTALAPIRCWTGKLGLGDDNTVISRFFRGSATELALNDNDNPAALNLGALISTLAGPAKT